MKNILLLGLVPIVLYSGDALQLSGQLVAESAWFDNEEGKATNEQGLRRARISLKGEPTSELKYEVEYSFTGNNNWKDVYVQYAFRDDYFLKVGNIKESIGLEALNSSKVNSFMERSLTQALLNKRKLGIQLHHPFNYDDHHYTLTTGIFGKSLDDLIDNEEDGNSVVTRATYAYIPQKNKLVHLGLATSYTDYEEQTVKLNTTPESDLFDRNLISTTIKEVKQSTKFALESALIWDNLSLQGEYIHIHIENTETPYNFQGWYLQGSWFITGESRKYKTKKAVFSRVKPQHPVNKGGLGAWEVAFRVSHLDIDDKDEEESEQTDYTIGVNWYATSHIRMMVNYVRAELSEADLSAENIAQVRVQYDF